MIQFNTPEWFFLIPLLLAAGWKYRRLRLASPPAPPSAGLPAAGPGSACP
ncbi:MAG: hypothetical protein LIO47_00880 [Akkermansia sp.]|nr:hypothetical protein [Akkermansia sp.]